MNKLSVWLVRIVLALSPSLLAALIYHAIGPSTFWERFATVLVLLVPTLSCTAFTGAIAISMEEL